MFQPISAFPAGGNTQALSETTMRLSFEDDAAEKPSGSEFGAMLGRVIQDIEKPKDLEDKLTMDLLAGKPIDTHDIMIAGAQGDLMLQMASTVVSKVANAYQTLINMQV
ncbi:MAG: flagellar hook-basal body complex protein FliE [Candidatus Sericytochromatia bacterium]|nr:flagellar hook-basal body complex protein FliE [Candidatus Sericytochromatia bacterium]